MLPTFPRKTFLARLLPQKAIRVHFSTLRAPVHFFRNVSPLSVHKRCFTRSVDDAEIVWLPVFNPVFAKDYRVNCRSEICRVVSSTSARAERFIKHSCQYVGAPLAHSSAFGKSPNITLRGGNGKNLNQYISRVVAFSFTPYVGDPQDLYIYHIDRDRFNNSFQNLQIMTKEVFFKTEVRHRHASGALEKQARTVSKPCWAYPEGSPKKIVYFDSLMALAKAIGTSSYTVSQRIRTESSKPAKGWILGRDKRHEFRPEGPVVSISYSGRSFTVAPHDGYVLARGQRWTKGHIRGSNPYRIFGRIPVHHLICTALHGPAKPGQVCMHVNSSLLDVDGTIVNRADNIAGWGTQQENVCMSQGISVIAVTPDGKRLHFSSIISARRYFNVSLRRLSSEGCCLGKGVWFRVEHQPQNVECTENHRLPDTVDMEPSQNIVDMDTVDMESLE